MHIEVNKIWWAERKVRKEESNSKELQDGKFVGFVSKPRELKEKKGGKVMCLAWVERPPVREGCCLLAVYSLQVQNHIALD